MKTCFRLTRLTEVNKTFDKPVKIAMTAQKLTWQIKLTGSQDSYKKHANQTRKSRHVTIYCISVFIILSLLGL